MTRQPTPANILDAVLVTDATGPDRTALRARLRWDYSQVAPVDRRQVEEAAIDILANGQRVQQAMQNASVAIGERLIAVKRLLQHGQFSDWCDQEFGMSQRTAQNLMNIARTFDGKSAEISFLTDSVLALLAAPSTPEPARQQAIDEAQSTGKSPSVKRTKDIIAEHRPSAISNPQSPISNPAPAVQPLELRTVGAMADHYVRHLLTQMDADAALDHVTSMGAIREIERLLSCQTSIARLVATAASDVLTGILDLDVSTAAEAATVQIIEYDAAAPLPAWADEPAPAHYTARQPHDDRLQPAQRLRSLYQAVIDSDDEYGALTGRFSDTLAVKRDLSAMIGHLDFLINAITHPEEVSAAD